MECADEQHYMQRAIELAARGRGWVHPNPQVGAVIVKDGRIIGEGYHQRCGELHAERNAFASLSESAEGATLYVTLEPCCHVGRTPPCTNAIIEHNIARVVIGSRDPNPLVSGKGAHMLREHGIEVREDFMRSECDALNPVFFHYISTGLPYVVMKYAMSLDGKIACHTGASQWITGELARKHVHDLRGQYSAILVGIGTVLADDPMLNCRIEGEHQPVRVIADSTLRTPLTSRIVASAREYETIVAYAQENPARVQALEAAGVQCVCVPNTQGLVDLEALMRVLGKQKLDSVLIEGGGAVHEAALKAGIVNHVYAYIAPKLIGGSEAKTPVEGMGVSHPDLAAQLCNVHITQLGEDVLLEYDGAEGRNHVYRTR